MWNKYNLQTNFRVCKVWNREADDVERLRGASNIVILGLPCPETSCERKKLQSYCEHVEYGSERKVRELVSGEKIRLRKVVRIFIVELQAMSKCSVMQNSYFKPKNTGQLSATV